jgi:amidase
VRETQAPRLHHVDATQVVYRYDKDSAPAVRVHSGDIVVLECDDCNHNMIQTPEDDVSKVDFDCINPATGPIYVEEAEAGDVLAVRILRIEVGSQGCALTFPGEYGFLKQEMEAFTKVATVQDGLAVFREDVLIPIRPSMGTFGVAPAGEPVLTLYPGDNGANMDHKEVRAGNTVYMPVFVPGALLAMGDAHAVIGDGESSGEGLEIPSVVTIQVEVLKGQSLPRPVIESPDEIMTCGWGMTMEEATTCAMRDMVDFLARKLSMSRVEAYSLLGMVGDARPGNAVCSPGAMRFVVPKGIFTKGITVP